MYILLKYDILGASFRGLFQVYCILGRKAINCKKQEKGWCVTYGDSVSRGKEDFYFTDKADDLPDEGR